MLRKCCLCCGNCDSGSMVVKFAPRHDAMRQVARVSIGSPLLDCNCCLVAGDRFHAHRKQGMVAKCEKVQREFLPCVTRRHWYSGRSGVQPGELWLRRILQWDCLGCKESECLLQSGAARETAEASW